MGGGVTLKSLLTGKLYLFVAIDRTSKFAFAKLHPQAGKMQAAQFLRDLRQVIPYAIHTILADNGIQFTNRKKDKYAFEHKRSGTVYLRSDPPKAGTEHLMRGAAKGKPMQPCGTVSADDNY
jgi:hypothetical protein